MGLEGGPTGIKPVILREADKGGAGGASGAGKGGTKDNNLLTTMMPGQPGAPAGGVTPDNTVVIRGKMADVTKDLGKAAKLAEQHGIKGGVGQQLLELARRIKAGLIKWE